MSFNTRKKKPVDDKAIAAFSEGAQDSSFGDDETEAEAPVKTEAEAPAKTKAPSVAPSVAPKRAKRKDPSRTKQFVVLFNEEEHKLLFEASRIEDRAARSFARIAVMRMVREVLDTKS